MTDKIGVDPEYMCFTKRGMKFMRELVQGYQECKRLSECSIKMSASPGLSQLLSSGVKPLMVKNDQVASAICVATDSMDHDAKMDEIFGVQRETNKLLGELLVLLHSNAFVTAVVMDSVVTVVATSPAETTLGAPPTFTQSTTSSEFSGTTVMGNVSMEESSQLTAANVFSPVSAAPTVKP